MICAALVLPFSILKLSSSSLDKKRSLTTRTMALVFPFLRELYSHERLGDYNTDKSFQFFPIKFTFHSITSYYVTAEFATPLH